jgi:hypothetical protein
VPTIYRQLVTILVLIIQLGCGVVPLRGILCLNQGECATPSHNAHVGGSCDSAAVAVADAIGEAGHAEGICCGRCKSDESKPKPVHAPVDSECPLDCNCCFEVTTQHTSIRPLTLSMGDALELSLAASHAVCAIMPLAAIHALPCTAPFGMPPPHAPLQPAAVGLTTVCLLI